MTDKKQDETSDAARTGEEADKNRDELVKKAEKGVSDAVKEDKREGKSPRVALIKSDGRDDRR